jgi:hypothetical protein
MKGTIEYGLLISVVGYTVTLITLALLYVAFQNLPRLLHLHLHTRLRKAGKPASPGDALHIPSDEAAAIAMALHLYLNELHDETSTKVTIRRVSKSYSPWNSKIFGMRHPIRR